MGYGNARITASRENKVAKAAAAGESGRFRLGLI